jgi:hypothetical protein
LDRGASALIFPPVAPGDGKQVFEVTYIEISRRTVLPVAHKPNAICRSNTQKPPKGCNRVLKMTGPVRARRASHAVTRMDAVARIK